MLFVDRYGVPGTHAKRLEEAMRFNAPARFEQERDLLHHLVALAPPSLLAAQGLSAQLRADRRVSFDWLAASSRSSMPRPIGSAWVVAAWKKSAVMHHAENCYAALVNGRQCLRLFYLASM